MKRAIRAGWCSDDGRELLEMSGYNEFKVIVATCDAERLRELGLAISDALGVGEGRESQDDSD